MKYGTNKFYAACWEELMRFLVELNTEDEENEYSTAQDMFALMCSVEKKVSGRDE